MICPNPKCERIVSPFDEECQHCHTPLKTNPVQNFAKEAESIVDKAKQKADHFIEEMYNGSFIAACKEKWKGMDLTKSLEDKESDGGDAWGRRWLLIDEVKGLVFANPHVTSNQAYQMKCNLTLVKPYTENMRVNAGASMGPQGPVIHLYDGYLNFLLAVNQIFKDRKLEKFKILAEMYTSANGSFTFSYKDAVRMAGEGFQPGEVLDDVCYCFFYTIAHELGHCCLDHILSPGYGDAPLDVSRNQEREADSFADCVVTSSIFKDKLFLAHLKCSMAWVFLQKASGQDQATTHPLAIERLKNCLRDNSDVARGYGLDEDWVDGIFA
jgi:hypothetical protein